MRRLHSLLGFAPTLVLRRAWRDAAPLLTVVAVLASSVFLAVALPSLVLSAVDSGAQEAVAEAGDDADIEIRTAVGAPVPRVPIIRPEAVLDLAAEVTGLLPNAIAQTYPDLVVTVLSPAAAVAAEGHTEGPRLTLQLGMLTPAATTAITLTDGSLPSAPRVGGRTEIGVVLSAEAAEAASLAVGDVIEFRDANVENVVVVVTGIVETADEGGALWQDSPTLWAPTRNDTGVALTVLTSPAGITAAEGLFSNPFTATLRLKADPTAFSSDRIAPVAAQLSALQVDGSRLAGDSGADLTVRSSFGTALGEYPGRARAAVAQMSVLISGVLAVAVAVIALLSRLLVIRRVSELALERARGASLASILVRALLESVAISALGVGLGLTGAWLVLAATASDAAPIALIAVVGIGAAPTQVALLIALADRRARRTAANRADRREGDRASRARRLVLEGLVIAVAAAALFAVRTRGLLQTRTDGVDPLLAATPVLLAAALVVLVLRVYPLAVRLAMSIGRRSRGALGTLGAMQAERALTVLPLASLTLAVALAVSGGLFVETVRSGQVDASWQRTGAEVRLEGPLVQSNVTAVAARPGVTAASGVLTIHETAVASGTISAVATLLAVDPGYGEVLEELPSVPGIAGDHDVSALFDPVGEGDPLRVLVDSRLARQLSAGEVTLTVGGETREVIPVEVVGTFDGAAGGYERGPFIYVDRAALITRVSLTVEVNTLLVMGPGAVVATEGLRGDVSSRAQWLVDRQQQALVAGVSTVMLASTASVAGLALIGLIASVLAGSRSRRRSLSLLRTLGMHARLGWWLAASELAPLVLAALLGGIVAGVGIVLVLGPAFGLETLAGGVLPPTLTISPWVIAGVAAGAVLLSVVAMLAEVAAHRRDRLSDVLRVGDSQ
jgi:putative ABC transport system permease protein